MRCCCGEIQFDDDDHTPIAFNDIVHEVLGPNGNFCGPSMSHIIRNLERQNDALRKERDDLAAELTRANKLCNSLRAEAQKDYEDMRRFQSEFIKADQECRALHTEVESLKQNIELLVTDKDNCAKNWYNCRADLAAAVEAAKAYQELGVCYRIGKRSTEKLFKKLDKANTLLARLEPKTTNKKES